MNENNAYESDLTIEDVVIFLKEQYKTICITFIVCILSSCVYLFTRPTFYESKTDLLVGNSIESADQIKYLYSDTAQIIPIKNTSVIQVVATSNSAELSKQAVADTVKRILDRHNELVLEKKQRAMDLIKATSNNNKQLIELIDTASTLAPTKQVNPVSTTSLPYSGLLKKGVGISFAMSAFFSLLLALALHRLSKLRQSRKSPT
jgi:uncharacterized protein involved in exopolysaccharide biosynthesis